MPLLVKHNDAKETTLKLPIAERREKIPKQHSVHAWLTTDLRRQLLLAVAGGRTPQQNILLHLPGMAVLL